MTELATLAESKVINDQVIAYCVDCHTFQLPTRIEAVQHVKVTGHTVEVERRYREHISPRPKGR